jgi:agmatine deiminase
MASEFSGPGEGDISPSVRWPAEWEWHRATWLAWPHNIETWPTEMASVEDAFCEIVRAILPGEAVEIIVLDEAMAKRVEKRLRGSGLTDLEGVRFHPVATDDAWIRDHGGVFVIQEVIQDAIQGVMQYAGRQASLRLIDFDFDAWGGKYPPWDHDAKVASEMARILDVPRFTPGMVLEAGAVEGDGEGTILTTEACLLNANRRRAGQDRSRESLEALLAETLGARRVLWLGEGLVGDDTDGHVDDLTRFVAPGRVVTVVESDATDADHAALAENRRRLETMDDALGRKLEVIELPTPGVLEGPDGRLPASYANFYFSNRALLVPVFGVDADREALNRLEAAVPDRSIIPIPSQNLVLGLGAVHCLTQQEPALAAEAIDSRG